MPSNDITAAAAIVNSTVLPLYVSFVDLRATNKALCTGDIQPEGIHSRQSTWTAVRLVTINLKKHH